MMQKIIETRVTPARFATAFVYCKYNDPQRSSFEEIMKSLIAQLAQNNQNCIDYLYAFALKSGERHAKTKKTFTQMLCSVVQCYDEVFIGIDGLDECELEERRQTIAALQGLLQAPEQDSKVKIILCSCAEKDIERALKGCHRLDLKSQHLSPSIRSYIRSRLTSLNQSFKFSKSTIEGIVDKVSSRSEGMFLLARLILDTLEDTGSREEVQEELANDTLLRGINEAYGRILARIQKLRTEANQSQAKLVLESLVAARRPLKLHEVQGILSIRLAQRNIDLENRRCVLHLKELCGPIIEITNDGAVDFVHSSAKKYLNEENSAFLDTVSASCKLTEICSAYLTFECFDPSMSQTAIISAVQNGSYALQDYAISNWIAHAKKLRSTSSKIEYLMECLLRFWKQWLASRYFTGPNPSSVKQDDCEADNFWLELEEVQASCNNFGLEESDEKLPMLHHVITIRSLIEEAAEREPKLGDMELLGEAYGEYYFKCPVFACAHFQQGFPSRAKREAHVKVHKLEYKCPHENCAFHITGFRSESELESHLSWFHEATQLPYMFPHLEPKSAWQSFEEAIDHDDVGVVRNFCLDSLDLPNPPELLLRAVKKGNFKSARVLAEYPELSKELYERNRKAEKSPLCLAAAKGESELTGYFLSLVTDGQIPFEFWRSTFMKVIRGHHSNVLRTILDSGKDLDKIWEGCRNYTLRESFASVANVEDEETTALLFRCLLNSSVSRKMIESIATAVAQKGDRTLVKRLFEFQENNGFPGYTKFTGGIEKLRSAGTDAMMERIMEQVGGVVDSNGKTWGNALQNAALKGNDEKIRMLLDSGADINHAESDLGTALQAAARNGHESTVLLLLSRGANPSISTGWHFGNPLAEAAAKGNCKIISIFLEAGVIPSICQKSGLREADFGGNSIPLHFAAKYAHVDAITLLLENGASASALDTKGNSALHYLANGAYLTKNKAKTPKQHEGALASIEVLVAHGGDVTAKNTDGNTPLHELWAQVKGTWRIKEPNVDYLLELSALFIRNGADLNAKNRGGHEIRDIAESSIWQKVKEAVGKISLLGASEQI